MQLFASFGYEATAQDDTKKKLFGVSVDERPTFTVGLKMGVNGAYVSDLYEDQLLCSPPTLETSLGRGIRSFNGAIRDRTPASFVWSTIQVIGITAAPYTHKTDKQRISLGLPADVPLVLTVIGGNADQHVIRVGRNGGASLRLKATELLLTYGDVTYGGTANFAASDVSRRIGGKIWFVVAHDAFPRKGVACDDLYKLRTAGFRIVRELCEPSFGSLYVVPDPLWEVDDVQEREQMMSFITKTFQNGEALKATMNERERVSDFWHRGERWVYRLHCEPRRDFPIPPGGLDVDYHRGITLLFEEKPPHRMYTIWPNQRAEWVDSCLLYTSPSPRD